MRLLASLLVVSALAFAGCASSAPAEPHTPSSLGAFSISLAVKDLAASRAFYEKLGFTQTGGDAAQKWLVLRNGDAVVGLFEGMLPKNTLTFNPGWNQQAQPVARFEDVRSIQARFEQAGLVPEPKADPASTGPGYLMLIDPDGNPVLIDQHVGKPQ